MSAGSSPQAFARLGWLDGLRIGLAAELSLLRRPAVLLAALAIIVVPSLYALIYVSSVWDPYGNLSQLPAALVNADQPVQRAGRTVSLGAQLVETLTETHPFDFKIYQSEGTARAAVQEGRAFFALILPPDFTR